jgi:hypothetical protein
LRCILVSNNDIETTGGYISRIIGSDIGYDRTPNGKKIAWIEIRGYCVATIVTDNRWRPT